MFEFYNDTVARYPSLPKQRERKLIKRAQSGNKNAEEELLLSHIGFFRFRIRTILFPALARRFGDDILQEFLLLASKKVDTFNLRYRDKKGRISQVYFRTYLWKAVTGLIFKSIEKYKYEIMFSELSIVALYRKKEDGQKVSCVYCLEQTG